MTNFEQNLSKIRNNYNKDNRGIDKFNLNISYYNVERKCYIWWKKIFFLLLIFQYQIQKYNMI